ncbi:MAG: VWA domain-containing protein, partial [Kamptonema sp. SIO4C4]|nr:VWA domain-containing protein [Kamptonema sp. SIO4C4]
MKVGLLAQLNDSHIDANQPNSQRQMSISLSAIAGPEDQAIPLNLCLVLDHSGSMNGQPLKTVKDAAINLVEKLNPRDRISVIAFDHRAKVLIPNQPVDDAFFNILHIIEIGRASLPMCVVFRV